MTAKDKALEIYNKYFTYIPFADELKDWEAAVAKQCSLIAVWEILDSFEYGLNRPLDNVSQTMNTPIGISEITEPYRIFWNDVRKEIEKL